MLIFALVVYSSLTLLVSFFLPQLFESFMSRQQGRVDMPKTTRAGCGGRKAFVHLIDKIGAICLLRMIVSFLECGIPFPKQFGWIFFSQRSAIFSVFCTVRTFFNKLTSFIQELHSFCFAYCICNFVATISIPVFPQFGQDIWECIISSFLHTNNRQSFVYLAINHFK